MLRSLPKGHFHKLVASEYAFIPTQFRSKNTESDGISLAFGEDTFPTRDDFELPMEPRKQLAQELSKGRFLPCSTRTQNSTGIFSKPAALGLLDVVGLFGHTVYHRTSLVLTDR